MAGLWERLNSMIGPSTPAKNEMLVGALLSNKPGVLNQPEGVLSQPATVNPLMLAKALRQEQSYPRTPISQAINAPMTWQQFFDNVQAHFPIDSPAAVRQAAFDLGKSFGPQMTVWHGSPHVFPPTKNNPLGEFDATKIGSGEGAQAYGYGHYVAEANSVGKRYQEALAMDKKAHDLNTRMQQLKVGGRPVTEFGIEMNPEFIDAARRGQKDALAHIDQRLESWKKLSSDPSYPFKEYATEKAKGFAALRAEAEAKGIQYSGDGSLYKVDLPDEHIGKMLDWDKPLSQQPESVRKALQPKIDEFVKQSMHGEDYLDAGKWIRTRDVPGSYLLNYISKSLGGNDKASAYLRDAGIPGIRYLDGGSRGAGTGTSNFVVFPGNEGILKILARE